MGCSPSAVMELARRIAVHPSSFVRFLVLIGLVFASRAAVAGPAEPVIEIRGNHVLTADQIRDGITADQSTLVDPHGDINQEAIERATLIVAAVYWDRGYAQVRVGEPKIDQTNHRVEFTITDEGPKFTIGTVRVTGTLLRTERAFLAMLQIKPSALFSRTLIANDREKLQRFYEDRGFAYVNVLPLTKVDLAKKTIALTFEITQGEIAFIEKLNVLGNTRTSTQTILDLMSIKEGELFHGTRLEASRKQLRRLFTDVVLSTKKGTDSSIVITVEVNE